MQAVSNVVDRRLERAFQVMKFTNDKPVAERRIYVRGSLRPIIENLNCPILKKALSRFADRIDPPEQPERPAPRRA